MCFRHVPDAARRWSSERLDALPGRAAARARGRRRELGERHDASRAHVPARGDRELPRDAGRHRHADRSAPPTLRTRRGRSRRRLSRRRFSHTLATSKRSDSAHVGARCTNTSARARSFCRLRPSTASYPPPNREPRRVLTSQITRVCPRTSTRSSSPTRASPVARDDAVAVRDVARLGGGFAATPDGGPSVHGANLSGATDTRDACRISWRDRGRPRARRGSRSPRDAALRRSRRAASSPARSRRTAPVGTCPTPRRR